MNCPKCGFEQDEGRECARCGVIFSRLLEPERPGRVVGAGSSAAGRGSRSAGWLLVAAVAVAALGWWVNRPGPEPASESAPEARVAIPPRAQRHATVPRSARRPAPGDAEGSCPLLDASSGPETRGAVGGSWLEAPEYAEAERRQLELGAPLLVYFRTDWCPYCRRLEQGLLANAEVESRLSDAVVRCRINPEESVDAKAVAKRYGVTGYPSLFLAAFGATPVKLSIYSKKTDALANGEAFLRGLRDAERRLSQDLVVAGDRARREGDLPGSLERLDRAVALSDGNADAFLYRGIARGVSGDAAGAFADFARAAELDPAEIDAYRESARLLGREGRWADAAACWDLYLADHPQSAEARKQRDQSQARAAS